MSDRLPEPQRFDEVTTVARASATPAGRAVLPPVRGGPSATVDVPRSLHGIQRWVLGAITSHASDGVERVVTPGPNLDAAGRLGIYQSAYHARLVECLADDYPVISAALGDARFAELGHAYVHEHPSDSPNLNAFGRHMSDLCRRTNLLSAVERAFYADLARLEWAVVEVVHERTPRPLDLSAFQSLPVEAWASASFVASGAVRLLDLAHPVNTFLQAYRDAGTVPELAPPSPATTVVYRAGPTVWRMDLTPAMARVLGALLDGATIRDALERMGIGEPSAEALAEAERSVMIWFREWVAGAMFSELRRGDE